MVDNWLGSSIGIKNDWDPGHIKQKKGWLVSPSYCSMFDALFILFLDANICMENGAAMPFRASTVMFWMSSTHSLIQLIRAGEHNHGANEGSYNNMIGTAAEEFSLSATHCTATYIFPVYWLCSSPSCNNCRPNIGHEFVRKLKLSKFSFHCSSEYRIIHHISGQLYHRIRCANHRKEEIS